MAQLLRPTLLVEYATTRDLVVDESDGAWSCRPSAPSGGGWRISDASSDLKTRWRRVRLVEADEALHIEAEGRRG